MPTALTFDDLIDSIGTRSDALRLAVGAASDLDARVPGCPDWSIRNLVGHLGEVQRFWAAVVAAGPADGPPPEDAVEGREVSGDLLAWFAESTDRLVHALRDAGPDRGCWTWWGRSGGPQTANAVARHQVQEAAVHAYDAQESIGRPAPVPESIAADAIDEFLVVSMNYPAEWIYPEAVIAVQVDDGPAWAVSFTADGAEVGDFPRPGVTLAGTASDLLLLLYRRVGVERVRVQGNLQLVEQLLTVIDTA